MAVVSSRLTPAWRSRLSSHAGPPHNVDVTHARLAQLLTSEFCHFESAAQCETFARHAIAPQRVVQSWAYSASTHECVIVARTPSTQIVYCLSGFGPAFPWSAQPLGGTDLGTDSMWHASLYECVIGTEIWPEMPYDFTLMAPGERLPRLTPAPWSETLPRHD